MVILFVASWLGTFRGLDPLMLQGELGRVGLGVFEVVAILLENVLPHLFFLDMV
jgi:hypothetical protein